VGSPINNYRAIETYIGTVDASGTPLYFLRVPEDCVLIDCGWITSNAIAAHAANIHTTTVTNRGQAAAGTTVVATKTTDSGVTGYEAITAKQAWVMTPASAAVAELSGDDVLEIAPTEGGAATSGDLADATFFLVYRPGHGVGYDV
jgi:hypothetical protein